MMKKFVALCLSLCLLLTPALAIKGEVVNPKDLPLLPPASSAWAQTEIMAAQEAGLLVDSLGPDFTVKITREQFAELAVNMTSVIYGEGPDILLAKTFTDCDNLQVRLASAAGIVDGVGGGKFDPTATTNREQIASMLYRAIGYLEKNMGKTFLSLPADTSAFSDEGEVSSWATDGVGALAAGGIMKGTSATTLSPQSPCTIEQSILLVYRIYTMFVI